MLQTPMLLFLRAFAFLFLAGMPGALRAEEAPRALKVGLVLPLSGSAAEYGIAIQNSIELARQDAPHLFEHIEFVYEDAAFDPKMALLALSKLIDGSKVDVTVTWGVLFCKTLAPVAEQRKIPLLGICLDPTVAKNRKYVIRFKNPIDDMMSLQAKYLKGIGVNRIAILLAEHPYLDEAYQALLRHLEPGQTVDLLGRIQNNDLDLRPHILKLKRDRNKYDAVGSFVFMGQVPIFYRQSNDLKLDLPTFGTDIFESLSAIRAAQGTMEGVVFTSIDIKKEFLDRYLKIFKNESQLSFGAPAYEMAMTIGRLFGAAGKSWTSDQIVHEISGMRPQPGVAVGPYRFVSTPELGQYVEFPVVTKRIRGETFESLR